MSRDINPNFVSALSLPEVSVFYAIELFFDTATLRFWSGLGEITFNGDVYTGSGAMIQISSVDETIDVSARGATLTLSGLPSELLSLAIQEPYQGRKCNIYYGALDANKTLMLTEDGENLVTESGRRIDLSFGEASAMAQIFSGYMDRMDIDESGETSTIGLYVESRLIDLKRARIKRYTSENQKAKFPNDKGFDFVEDLQQKKFTWGR